MQNRMHNTATMPGVVKHLSIVLLTAAILYFAKALFIPMFFGLLIAIVMYPVCKWLEEKHISKSIAITISLSIVGLLFVALTAVLLWQISLFSEDLPGIIAKMKPLLASFQNWLEANSAFSVDMQKEWLHNTAINSSASVRELLEISIGTISNTLFWLFLTPIYSALFLYHRKTFVKSLQLVIDQRFQPVLSKILSETVLTYFNYIKGMILVYIIVGVLNSIGLLALGLKHAVLFGMLTAIMTIIPYVGIIISALLPISVAFVTKDSIIYPLAVIAVFSFVQYLEANIIFPKVVGSQLNVSTWATLVGIIAGGILWGVAGMVLFIPFVAILKIVSDNIPEWKALNLILSRNEE